MSAIFNDPLILGGLYNPNIQANKFTPLNLFQNNSPIGTAPTSVPTLTEELQSNPLLLVLQFDTTESTGTLPLSYSMTYGTESSGVYDTPLVIEQISENIYTTQVENLTPAVIYGFILRAENAYGFFVGNVEYFTLQEILAPPSNVPDLEFISATTNSITIHFNDNEVQGTQPITYTCMYAGGFLSPDTVNNIILISPNIYEILFNDSNIAPGDEILPNTLYQFQLSATNSVASITSPTVYAFSTLT